jgi:hypothetical protein
MLLAVLAFPAAADPDGVLTGILRRAYLGIVVLYANLLRTFKTVKNRP